MARRCSHCSHNGHNTRTCPNRGVKLFGVRLTDHGSIRKSASMGNLSHLTGHHHQNGGIGSSMNPGSSGDNLDGGGGADHGYASEDFVAGSSEGRERKRGVPWTEEEHKMFLLGLQKLGKGDWRGISRKYVITRTPTQVASHAQKYFIRRTNFSRRKRRSSLFDMVAEDIQSPDTPMVSHDFFSANPPESETRNNIHLPAGASPLPPTMMDEECESMASSNSNSNEGEAVSLTKPHGAPQSSFLGDASQNLYPVVYPSYVSPFLPYAIPFLAAAEYDAEPRKKEVHEVLKPRAEHTKTPIDVDELVGMTKLSLGGDKGPSNLSLKLIDGSNRQSAFHANYACGGDSTGGSPIHAI